VTGGEKATKAQKDGFRAEFLRAESRIIFPFQPLLGKIAP
jgi:hypothetical protein